MASQRRTLGLTLLIATLATGCAGLRAGLGSAEGGVGLPVRVTTERTGTGGTASVTDPQTGDRLVTLGLVVHWPAVLVSAKRWLLAALPDVAAVTGE